MGDRDGPQGKSDSGKRRNVLTCKNTTQAELRLRRGMPLRCVSGDNEAISRLPEGLLC